MKREKKELMMKTNQKKRINKTSIQLVNVITLAYFLLIILTLKVDYFHSIRLSINNNKISSQLIYDNINQDHVLFILLNLSIITF